MGFGETSKFTFVHKIYDVGIVEEPDSDNEVKKISKYLAREYGIGTMTLYLGVLSTRQRVLSEESNTKMGALPTIKLMI